MYIKWILLEFVWTIIITTFNWNVLKKIILRKWICFINLWSSYHTLNAQCTNCVKYLYIKFFLVNFANLKYFYIYSAFLRLPGTPYVLYNEISHSNVYINFLIFHTFLWKKKISLWHVHKRFILCINWVQVKWLQRQNFLDSLKKNVKKKTTTTREMG